MVCAGVMTGLGERSSQREDRFLDLRPMLVRAQARLRLRGSSAQ